MAILAISHVMKSTGYEHQNHKFRVFRQSLQENQVSLTFDILQKHAIEVICDKLDIFANLKGYFYINPKLLIETLMRHCLNNFYQKA